MADSSNEFNYKKLLYMLNNRELAKLAEFILKDTVDTHEEVEKLANKRFQKQIFTRVNTIWSKYCDFRTHLWLSLPVEHRMLLIISEYDQREADLMSMLLFQQYKNK